MLVDETIVAIIVPFLVCVVLPVAIVALVCSVPKNNDNNRTKVLLKAIESNCSLDADKLAEALNKPKKTERERLNLRLLRGCIFTFAGIALCAVGVVSLCMGAPAQFDSVTFPLMIGGASLGVGISYLVVYSVTRKQIKD